MLQAFHQFYQENIDKCDVQSLPKHPINTERLSEWTDAMVEISKSTKNEYVKYFAYSFAKNVRNVSYDEFRNRLSMIAMELKIKIEEAIEREGNINVVLIIPGAINKSNVWVALLLYKVIGHYVTDVVEYPYQITDNGLYTIGIYPDDASYSGTQARSGVSSIEDKYDIYLACPYVSDIAIDRFPETIHLLDNTEIFESFSTIFTREYSATELESILSDRYFTNDLKVSDRISYLYFDHKLPDAASTFQFILAYGALYGGTLNRVGSLIKGCETYDRITRPEYNKYYTAYPNWMINNSKLNCPNPFYKEINYTYQGQSLNKNVSIDQLAPRTPEPFPEDFEY